MTAPRPRRRLGGALAVGLGIFLSRIAGLVRERVLAHYLGRSDEAGAFRAALRIPNFLQNLLGEGVLSAAFIPVYTRLRAEGRDAEAQAMARVVGTLLAVVAAAVTVLGVVAAGPLTELIAPGFTGATRDLTVRLVQITFPGVALLVLSAWCLGVQNSHRKFFLSYVSPVVWNAVVIGFAIALGRRLLGQPGDLAEWIAWGTVAGSAAQLAVQLPTVWRLLGGLRPSLAMGAPGVGASLRAFGPVVIGRGSVQLSSYLDQILASYLGSAIVAGMSAAQVLATLPVSLFGMAVSAAELPEMARATGDPHAIAAAVRARLAPAMRRVVFLVAPSAVAFVALAGEIVGLVFQTGRFSAEDTQVVALILAGSALGLLANTQGRLLASAFYAMGDTKTPLRAALVRVAVAFVLGLIVALPLRDALGYSTTWGAFGLTAAAAAAAWIEYLLLRRALGHVLGGVPAPRALTWGAVGAAVVAGALTWMVVTALGPTGVVTRAALALPLFGLAYLWPMLAFRVPEATSLVRRFTRRRG
ncbi:MAG: murein biosynthesis integral membrane protein MurJ [Kofleriaceae bacterium]|jgi:putative peptidoglycan lipid II flippase|nr:murein biosynthesis integral membrane protein MurJ [Kofleriaceae bacterium]MBP9168813.1 murein biosynthesis integral membrane protein MurJ [Kofleriaceae bacterium]MBP9863199.1 murein biosynthesis integral membrane protein MurJ [Kofleriaceae bacterium]